MEKYIFGKLRREECIVSMPLIQLYVCCHQLTQVPTHPLLIPIQTGAALTAERFPGFLVDNVGANISAKNRAYCELTAQYWAWKNAMADYYGFFHYRRFLYPDIHEKKPYRIEASPTIAILEKLRYDRFTECIEACDLIAPIGERIYRPVLEHYAAAPFHHGRDLERVREIVEERYPEFGSAMETYLTGTICYFGNIYIMRRSVFEDYCAWLFHILDAFDRRTDMSGYSTQERRVDGYLAERLFGIYYTYQKQRQVLRMLELPRVHFIPERIERRKKRLMNAVLPPGSHRWAVVKGLFM